MQLLDSSQRLPFDIANMRTIKFDIHDVDSVEQAREELVAQINDLKNTDTPVDTPISVARDIKKMWESEDPTSHRLAEVLTALSSLKAEIETQRQSSLPSSLYASLKPDLRLGEGSFVTPNRLIGSAIGQESLTMNQPIGAAFRSGLLKPFDIYGIHQELPAEERPSRKRSPERARRRPARSKPRKRKPAPE